MEQGKADVRSADRGASGDNAARFLHELRQLRNGAGLGHAELAARAHYPYDLIRAAEAGPSLPDLPVLSAFVRGCGGTTEDWEERWRSLTRSPSLPVAESRQSGQSDAATAGARISTAAPAGDGPDPSVIMAALNRVAEEMASPADATDPAPPVAPSAPGLPPSPAFAPGAAAVDKTAGWDPIRVSSAWPVLKHTPTVAEPAGTGGDGGPASGVGAPWDTAPWVDDPAEAAAPASSGLASPGGPTPAGTSAAARPAAAGRSARTTLIVVAVILLGVLAVLLGIFV